MRWQVGGPFICQNGCGRAYKYKKNLNKHMNYECGERRDQFKCSFCNRTFSQRFSLRSHSIIVHRTLL